VSEKELTKRLLEGHVDPVRLRENIQRIRENIETVRDGFGALFENRPILGALRDFRRRLRQWRSAESRSQPVYAEQPGVVEYDEVREVRTEDGKVLRLYLNHGRVVYVEEIEQRPESEQPSEEQEQAGDVRTTVSPEKLPPRLIVRERPRIRRPSLIQSLREYVQAVVEERKLETEYQKFRLQLLKKQAEQPVRREEKSEKQGFHV